MVSKSSLIASCCCSLLLICWYVSPVGYWKTNQEPIMLLGMFQGDMLYYIYTGISYTSTMCPILLHGIWIACKFIENVYCSCWIFPKANYPVILSTGFNMNAVMILVGEVFTIWVLYDIRRIIGDQCVFTYLLLGGVWWWLRGEVSLAFEDYCVFICVK